MKRFIKYLPIAMIFLACDNATVSRVEYEEVLSRADSLEARCDELELELSDLRLYNEYLEGEGDCEKSEMNEK